MQRLFTIRTTKLKQLKQRYCHSSTQTRGREETSLGWETQGSLMIQQHKGINQDQSFKTTAWCIQTANPLPSICPFSSPNAPPQTSLYKPFVTHSTLKIPFLETLDQSRILPQLTTPVNRSFDRGGGVLLKAQLARHSLERDEQVLSNRIKMLQQEEERMLKKIEETRVQAERIQHVSERNHKKNQAKQQLRRSLESRLDIQREEIRLQKEHQRQKMLEQAQKHLEERKEQYHTKKKQAQQLETIKKDYLAQIRQYNTSRRDKVREYESRMKEKLTSHWGGKVEISQLNYLEKLEREKLKLQDKARSITRMEQIEEQLMDKLKQTQVRQRDAASVLDTIKQATAMRSNLQKGGRLSNDSSSSLVQVALKRAPIAFPESPRSLSD
ncbi:hypothetical protein FGO68_gene6804 [Halteria grandinella]|uniref:Uncharacterized protein n=1 Tax=Halteria grandinella TaxID=5974 RepID=A0A8J8SWC1_HALGN|nr:hypothetical protein FGO68_gene6804 [Halteria grandinella]